MTNKLSEETKEAIYDAQNGFCAVNGCVLPITDFHHIVHNTKVNQKLYPMLLHSPINIRGCCRNHHERYTMHPELNDRLIIALAEVIEEYLEKITKIRR